MAIQRFVKGFNNKPMKSAFLPMFVWNPVEMLFFVFRLSSGPFGGWLGASMKVWRNVSTWSADTCFRWCQQCLRCVTCSWAPATFMFAFLKYTFVCLSLRFLIWSLMICSPVASAGWVLEDVDAVEDLFLFSTAALMLLLIAFYLVLIPYFHQQNSVEILQGSVFSLKSVGEQ